MAQNETLTPEARPTIARREQRENLVLGTSAQDLAVAAGNRRKVLVLAGIVLSALVIGTVLILLGQSRAEQARNAFGSAMAVYQTPLDNPAQPPEPGVKTFATAAERGKAASPLFAAVADRYGFQEAGRNARYFAAVTALDAGDTQTAEDTLNKVAESHDRELSSLAKFTLAGLYRQTGRDAQAIALYNQLSAKPTTNVPATSAQMALAELYTAEGKTEQARKLLAQIKDKDKDAKGTPGVASSLATQKLNPAAATGGPALQ